MAVLADFIKSLVVDSRGSRDQIPAGILQRRDRDAGIFKTAGKYPPGA